MGDMKGWWRVVAPYAVWSIALGGCATGDDPDLTGHAFDGGPVGGMSSSMASTMDGADDDTSADSTEPPDPTNPTDPTDPDSGDGPMPPDLGTCEGDGDCILVPGFCLQTQGQCVAGMCEHAVSAPGEPCDDADPCTETDTCDAEGVCFGTAVDCNAPNASGGECIAGMCTEPECNDGWADCNGDMSDGCEVELGTDSNCSACGDTCTGAAHADASCQAGSCAFQCQAPWDNCDGDWNNGCEIPVGVAHQCDATGLNPGNGCWTAYCGASGAAAANFGTYYCMDCATCRSPAAGTCQWCDHDSGVFFPTDSCGCGGFEDLAC